MGSGLHLFAADVNEENRDAGRAQDQERERAWNPTQIASLG